LGTDKPRFSITVSEDLYEKINQYHHEKRFSTQTKAISSLLQLGLESIQSKLAPPSNTKSTPSISDEAQKVAKDYEGLDVHGKTVVRVVLTEEQKRISEELRRRRERRDLYDEFGDPDGEPAEIRVIPLYLTPAAAGMASPAFGEDFEYLEVKDNVPRQADFAVRIDGNSMEPYLMDGSIAYVNRDPLTDGDVGIFFLDGDMLCKQYHQDAEGDVHLLSLNRERSDADRTIPAESGSTLSCYGRVILPHQINVVKY